MTAEGWSAKVQAGRDATWAAWRRLTVDPFALLDTRAPVPPILADLARGLTGPIAVTTAAVLDELPHDLDAEARQRITAAAVTDMLTHVLWAIGGAVGGELARPEPMPYSAPPAGSWIRDRYLDKPTRRQRTLDTGPRWHGAWHRFTGDLHRGDERMHEVDGLTRCGRRVTLRSFRLYDGELSHEAAVAVSMPDVDYCRKCARA